MLQALHCCIAGVTAITSSPTGECCIALRQLLAEKSLTFTVVDILNNSTVLAVDVHLSIPGRAKAFLPRKMQCIALFPNKGIFNSLLVAQLIVWHKGQLF